MAKNHFVNASRSARQRRVRYCFLRQYYNRDIVRGIVGRSDAKIVQTLENLEKTKFSIEGLRI